MAEHKGHDLESVKADTDVAEGKLETLGIHQETKRYIKSVEILGLGWGVTNSWMGVASTLSLVVAAGGGVTLLYGAILMFIIYAGIIFTLAELVSVFPTAGGQYHWTAILAPESFAKGLSYICGMTNTFSWVTGAAGICTIISQFILAMAMTYNLDYVPEAWNYFLLYVFLATAATLYNVFAIRKTMWIYTFGRLSLVGFLIILVTCVSRAPSYQTTSFVWTDFLNFTGWKSNGVVFFIGLIAPNYMYAAVDGAVHLAEEVSNATTAIPRALLSTWIIGFTTTFTFCIAIMYSGQDFVAIAETPTLVPLYELCIQATRSRTAATVFLSMTTTMGVVALLGAIQTSSRLLWSLARDDALIFSRWVSIMDSRWESPIWALLLNFFIVLCIGCVQLGSSAAFNAIVGVSLILQLISYAMPSALLLYRRRSTRFLPRNRDFKISFGLGWVANILPPVWAIVGTIFYCFPFFRPVTGSNMNYAAAVLACMILFGVLNWFVWARKHFHGPRMETQTRTST